MPEPRAYWNDRFLPVSEARLPLHDAGFVFGATITDLCRTFHRRPFRLADHLRRFRASCEAAGVQQPRTDKELTTLVEELLAANADCVPAEGELAVVLLATPGPLGYYLGEPGGAGDGRPTFGIHTFPVPFGRYRSLFREGARLVIPLTRQVSPATLDPAIKHRSRLHWWLADREARRCDPGANALLLDENGCVTETATANLLVVRHNSVLSPPRRSILPGVSLQVTEELCRELGVVFEERPLTPSDCREADEVLLTNTNFCLAGVSSIDGYRLPWPGPVLKCLLNAWNGRVGLDVCRQILTSQ